ncbi:MAG TPA: hypothetical protein VIV15_13600 [Anaerolineales bacterium]
MKTRHWSFALAALCILLSCLGAYLIIPQPIKWAVTSLVDVPLCTARVADKLGIQSNFTAVKHYVVQSLKLGMTPKEVEQTLDQIGPVHIRDTFLDEEQKTHTEILVELCNNPFGNVVLLLYYSEDGHLLNVVDAYAE